MKKRLSDSKIQYILEHLGHHARISEEISSRFKFGSAPELGKALICFPSSDEELEIERVIYIDQIPILYPVEPAMESFFSLQQNNLVFHHDLLKSAFHLLSGYDEFKSDARDEYDRFPYTSSLQHSLGTISRPLVNYYFDIILNGIEQFCHCNGLHFERIPVFQKPTLMLSHDIDFIDAYDFNETGFKFKMLLGMAKSPYSISGRFKAAFTALYHFLNPFSKKNPFWNFDFLQRTESDREIRSTYFFLEKDGRNTNSRYRFQEKRIRNLIAKLTSEGYEVGLHGTMQSALSQSSLDLTLKNLQDVSPKPVVGIRQHFLKYSVPETTRIQEKAGLQYDSTLGFAQHEGFRNSYCWPFRMYDFENDRPAGIWEIPLTVMDVTLFAYRKLDFQHSMKAITELVNEVQKFNGVFSLLWHNSFFDELQFPGITRFYLQLLDFLRDEGLEGITGNEILSRIKNNKYI